MNLLLVDSTIPEKNNFLNSINNYTKAIIYSINDTFESLKEKIDNLENSSFDNIGFVFVDEATPLKMFVSYNTFMSFSQDGIIENNTTKFIKELVYKYSIKKLDFLACNLLSYPEWKNYFDYLMKQNEGLIVRASKDKTGNLSAGGDWILESTNEDMRNVYFNDNIGNWNELLDLNSDSSIIQSFDSNLLGCGKNNNGEMNNSNNYGGNYTFNKIYDGTNIAKIACGRIHTMILLTDGTIWGCGDNNTGQLGIEPPSTTTITIKIAQNFTQAINTWGSNRYPIDIACGGHSAGSHTMILLNDGTVWGCGDSTYGQVGVYANWVAFYPAFTQATNEPNTFSSDKKATKIACGDKHTMIIVDDGTIWGCGSSSNGQMGIGSVTNKVIFWQAINTYGVNRYPIDIACGTSHTMIILNDGTVWGCGANNYGQIANGTDTTDCLTFVQAKKSDDSFITNAVKITCGSYHSIVKVVSDSSTFIYSTGLNSNGQLGTGDTINQNKFKMVFSDVTDNNVITSIICGYNQSFYIKKDGTIWACGYNNTGQLGLSYVQNTNSTFTEIFAPETGQITNCLYLSVGLVHTVILRNYGTYTETWGSGSDLNSQLNTSYMKKNFYSLTGFYKNSILCISNGLNYTMIVKNDGTVWGCGRNDVGQLGDGTTVNKKTFTKALNINDAVFISCGSKHSIVILKNGTVWGCGLNTSGQLGNGTTVNKSTFTQSNDASGIITDAIYSACGDAMTLIIRKSDTNNTKTIWGCGLNSSGQLGLPTTTTSSKVFVASNGGITNAEKLACGFNFTMVLREDGIIAGCGANDIYQLGLGNNVSPVILFTSNNTPISNVKHVSCGNYFTIILKNDGTIWSVGSNAFGQLGNGTTNTILTFTQVANITNAISLNCFTTHAFVILANKRLMACGRNNYGQLGLGDLVNKSTFTEVSYGVPKLKIVNKKKNINVYGGSTIQTFNNLENVISYVSDTITSSISSTDVSPSDTTSAFYGVNGKDKVIKLEPSGTIFSDYIYFDVNINTVPAQTLVYFKSDIDTEPVRLSQNPTNIYGAYYAIPVETTNTIRIFTKHFTEVGFGTGNFCLLKGTKVLTPLGYKLIETLKINDNIITDDNRKVPIKMIFKSVINPNEKPNFIPYKIEKNSIEDNYPSEDTYMSGYHMIKYNDNWIEPVQCSKFNKDLTIKEIVYYHIQLENYKTDNLVINGGLIVESLGDGSTRDSKIWVERSQNSIII